MSFFFFNDTATTEIYTLSLHDALPISYWVSCSGPGHRRTNTKRPSGDQLRLGRPANSFPSRLTSRPTFPELVLRITSLFGLYRKYAICSPSRDTANAIILSTSEIFRTTFLPSKDSSYSDDVRRGSPGPRRIPMSAIALRWEELVATMPYTAVSPPPSRFRTMTGSASSEKTDAVFPLNGSTAKRRVT